MYVCLPVLVAMLMCVNPNIYIKKKLGKKLPTSNDNVICVFFIEVCNITIIG